ncbi:9251_t:CDS:2, partial [Rhizophagus irregularis]
MSTHKRKSEEWDIIGFLNECHLETKQQLIECYLLSLEEIIFIKNVENKWYGGDLQILYHSSLRVEPQNIQSSSFSDVTWIGTVNSNTGTANTGIIDTRSSVSEKRKFPEINESDPTEIEKSNATSEDNEDVNGNNIINDEQVKEHNLEKSWEFKELIPNGFINFSLLSNLPSDWKVLEPPVERCLHSIATLDKKGLKKVAKTVIHHSICDAINKIQKILTTSNKVEDENPFLNSHLLKSPTADNIVQDGDYKHPD